MGMRLRSGKRKVEEEGEGERAGKKVSRGKKVKAETKIESSGDSKDNEEENVMKGVRVVLLDIGEFLFQLT
jgi:hypothetical protein